MPERLVRGGTHNVRIQASGAFALGANEVVVSRNAHEMAAHAKRFDFILNTVAAPHDHPFFGIPETQEMLDFCAEHDIVADIEMIRATEINEAYERIDNTSLATA